MIEEYEAMTLIIELTPEEESCLKAKARRMGLAPVELLRRFITEENDGVGLDPTYSTEWSEQDRHDFTAAALRRADQELGEETGYDA